MCSVNMAEILVGIMSPAKAIFIFYKGSFLYCTLTGATQGQLPTTNFVESPVVAKCVYILCPYQNKNHQGTPP